MFRKMIIILMMMVAAGMTIFGCGQVQKNYSAIANFPHANGNRWQYKNTMTVGTSEGIYIETHYFNGFATLESGLKVQNYSSSQEVVKKLLFSSSVKACALSSAGYYLIDTAGVHSYGNPFYATSEASLILPLPLDVGTSWQRNLFASFEAVAREEITVPAGTFSTIKVAMKNSVDVEYYEWYADGVGLVKSYNKTLNVLVMKPDGSVTSETSVATLELMSKNF